MHKARHCLFAILVLVPALVAAAIGPADLPSASRWYFHADLAGMRGTPAGRHLHAWLEREAFEEIRTETGVDLGKEADSITAFAGSDEKIIVVLDGPVSPESRDKVIAFAAASGSLDRFGDGPAAYYHVKETNSGSAGNVAADSFDDGAWFSFAVSNKLIVTSSEDDMRAMLARQGRVRSAGEASGTLLVLSADRSLVQAGLDTGDFAQGMGWDSNIIRNTEQLALLVADDAGMLSVQLQLLAAEQTMAESLGSIVRGLISLQVFNQDLDPDVAKVLQNTEVAVDGSRLNVSVRLDPEAVVAALEE